MAEILADKLRLPEAGHICSCDGHRRSAVVAAHGHYSAAIVGIRVSFRDVRYRGIRESRLGNTPAQDRCFPAARRRLFPCPPTKSRLRLRWSSCVSWRRFYHWAFSGIAWLIRGSEMQNRPLANIFRRRLTRARADLDARRDRRQPSGSRNCRGHQNCSAKGEFCKFPALGIEIRVCCFQIRCAHVGVPKIPRGRITACLASDAHDKTTMAGSVPVFASGQRFKIGLKSEVRTALLLLTFKTASGPSLCDLTVVEFCVAAQPMQQGALKIRARTRYCFFSGFQARVSVSLLLSIVILPLTNTESKPLENLMRLGVLHIR